METPAHTTLDPSDLLCSCATNQRHPAVLCPCPWGQSCFASLKGTTQNLADGFDWFILDLLLTAQSTMFLYALPVISLRWFWLYCIHYKNVKNTHSNQQGDNVSSQKTSSSVLLTSNVGLHMVKKSNERAKLTDFLLWYLLKGAPEVDGVRACILWFVPTFHLRPFSQSRALKGKNKSSFEWSAHFFF